MKKILTLLILSLTLLSCKKEDVKDINVNTNNTPKEVTIHNKWRFINAYYKDDTTSIYKDFMYWENYGPKCGYQNSFYRWIDYAIVDSITLDITDNGLMHQKTNFNVYRRYICDNLPDSTSQQEWIVTYDYKLDSSNKTITSVIYPNPPQEIKYELSGDTLKLINKVKSNNRDIVQVYLINN